MYLFYILKFRKNFNKVVKYGVARNYLITKNKLQIINEIVANIFYVKIIIFKI